MNRPLKDKPRIDTKRDHRSAKNISAERRRDRDSRERNRSRDRGRNSRERTARQRHQVARGDEVGHLSGIEASKEDVTGALKEDGV